MKVEVKINAIVHLEIVRGLRLNQFRLQSTTEQSRPNRIGLAWTELDRTGPSPEYRPHLHALS